MVNRKFLDVGDIRYIGGFRTKVRIDQLPNLQKPYCEILEVSPNTKYKIGDIVKVHRNLLHPKLRMEWRY